LRRGGESPGSLTNGVSKVEAPDALCAADCSASGVRPFGEMERGALPASTGCGFARVSDFERSEGLHSVSLSPCLGVRIRAVAWKPALC
jgi:hypothetical protein